MAAKGKKSVSFNTLVRMFLRDYNIPTRKDVEKLMTRLDRLEQMVKNIDAGSPVRLSRSRSGGGPGAASDQVVEVIREFSDGAGFADIQKRTGFGEKKLRNIIFRLHKDNRIQRVSRGIYTAAPMAEEN